MTTSEEPADCLGKFINCVSDVASENPLEIDDAHNHGAPWIDGQVSKAPTRIEAAHIVVERVCDDSDAADDGRYLRSSHLNFDENEYPRIPASLCNYSPMKPSDALEAHRAELRELVGRHGLLGARVFGSVLSRTDTDESDLDLLVLPAEKTGLMALAAFKIEAERLLGVEVSVVTPNALPPEFRSSVLQKAEAL